MATSPHGYPIVTLSDELNVRAALPFPYEVEVANQLMIAIPYIGFQWSEMVNRRIWIHVNAFRRVRRQRHTRETVIHYTTSTGRASFSTTVEPDAVRDAVDSVRARMAQLKLVDVPEARFWLQHATQPACIAGWQFREPGSSLAMVETLYRLGARDVRVRLIVEHHGMLHANQIAVILPDIYEDAQPLLEFLAQEAMNDYGCSIEPDEEPHAFVLSWM